MVSTDGENPVYGIKLSSVVPAEMTGNNRVHELSSMDLVMKLHYLRGVYFFNSKAVQGLKIIDFKNPMFKWLELHSASSGRVRRSESGRPFIRCNDSGVRIIEAQCNKTLEEWQEMKDCNLHNHLVSNQVLGPDLAFSPLILLQFTWFKCGGMAMGLRWAHILGDAFSAIRFINLCGRIIAGYLPSESLDQTKSETKTRKYDNPSRIVVEPLSVKQIEPVGDYWLTKNNCKMETYSFQITSLELTHLQSKMSGKNQSGETPPFVYLSAEIWQCLARIRESSEPRIVTFCRNNSHNGKNGTLGNHQIISVVKAEFSVADANPSELAALIVEGSMEEKRQIEETVERDQGLSDFIIYGANLTFVDLEEAELYGLELKGEKPVFANYAISGIGDEGVVLVLPGPENVGKEGGGGRTVTVILPENQVSQLKNELSREWCIA